jgi:hypothetical protein
MNRRGENLVPRSAWQPHRQPPQALGRVSEPEALTACWPFVVREPSPAVNEVPADQRRPVACMNAIEGYIPISQNGRSAPAYASMRQHMKTSADGDPGRIGSVSSRMLASARAGMLVCAAHPHRGPGAAPMTVAALRRAGSGDGAWPGARASDHQRERWLQQVRRTGACRHPVRLRGVVLRGDEQVYSTADEPDGALMVRCGDRREACCLSCAHEYRGDMWQFVYAGMAGGRKGVPESVAAHPQVFVSLTAPSVGAVHGRPDDGRACRCGKHHEPDDPKLGVAINPDTYDYRLDVSCACNVCDGPLRSMVRADDTPSYRICFRAEDGRVLCDLRRRSPCSSDRLLRRRRYGRTY